MAAKPKLSRIVAKQLPDFIREDYQTFVSFIEAYYEFLETQEVDVFSSRDIDQTLDRFIANIKNELDYNGVKFADQDERFLLKNIKQMYLAKGSEASYKLFFRLLFNKEVELFYPGQFVLRASDGKWTQETSLYLETVSGDPYEVVGKQVEVVTSSTKTSAIVERVRATDYPNLVEAFLEGSISYRIPPGSLIQNPDFVGEVMPSTTSFKILKKGKRFKAGQIFEVRSGSDGSGSVVKVKSVDSTGGITGLQFLKFGYGYVNDFFQTFSPVVVQAEEADPFIDSTNGFIDEGIIISPDYFEPSYADGTYSGTTIGQFYSDSSSSGEKEDEALIQFNIGGRLKYPGFYKTNDGFLSDSIYLQDSKYYQVYSYVIKIDETLDKYKEVVKSYLHPAGFALFGEYQVNNNFRTKAQLKFILNFFRVALNDSVSIGDSAVKSMSKVLFDTFTAPDTTRISFSTSFSDTVTPASSNVISFTKRLEDVQSVSDLFEITVDYVREFGDIQVVNDMSSIQFSTEFSDGASVSDSSVLEFTKYLEDTNPAVDAGGYTYFNYYSEPLYWDQTYSEGAEPF